MPKKQAAKTRCVPKEIRQAVEAIPDLIMEEMTESKDMPAADLRGAKNRPSAAGKRCILWVGVSIMTLLIGGLWYGNLRAFFTALKPERSAEAKLLSGSANDFREIIRISEEAGAARAKRDSEAFAAALAAKVQEAVSAPPTSTGSTVQ